MKINNLAEKVIKPLSHTMATFLNSQMYGNIYHLNIQTICTIIWLHFLTEMYIINVHIYEEANVHSKYFFKQSDFDVASQNLIQIKTSASNG